jgi:hypothetical protein
MTREELIAKLVSAQMTVTTLSYDLHGAMRDARKPDVVTGLNGLLSDLERVSITVDRLIGSLRDDSKL